MTGPRTSARRPRSGPTPPPDAGPGAWDIFCQVVDNYGDIGVCWRLACDLALRGQAVRLYVDDVRALAWMAPEGCPGVQLLPSPGLVPPAGYDPAPVVVAAFGCTLDATVREAMQRAAAPPAGTPARRITWIHLEYLSAQDYVARSHGLASPVLGGAAAGVHRWFFFPGFTPDTGGLLREPGLAQRRRRFERRAWLAGRGIDWAGEPVLSLFCYEPPRLAPWLRELGQVPARLLVTHGRAQAALRQALATMGSGWNAQGALQISYLPPLTQLDFDHLLWSSDINFVRGEDSLVRAIWAGTALVWQPYPQGDEAHHDKLGAFLDWLAPPASLRSFMLGWNDAAAGPLPPMLAAMRTDAWGAAVRRARVGLLAQDDLVSRLLRFVAKNR